MVQTNREIKFRAWDGEKIVYNFLIARPQAADCLSIMTDEKFAIKNYRLKEWKIMQYVESHDKYGKEIYENDIVKFYYADREETGIIYFRNGKFLLSPTIALGDCDPVFIEILGNKFENPEIIRKLNLKILLNIIN